MADSIIVGNFVGEDALAAVGASYSFTTVFIMIAIGGGIGASVLTSQYLGARQYEKMKTSVHTFLWTFLAVSIVLAALGLIFNPTILKLLKTPENILMMPFCICKFTLLDFHLRLCIIFYRQILMH